MRRESWLLLAVFGALMLVGGGVFVLTRGLRNNNPLNIRRSADKWLGLQPTQTDAEFFQFVDPVYGFRAGARILRNYRDRHGLDTIEKIIARWSPPSENKTREITERIAARMRLSPTAPFALEPRLPELMSLMTLEENGRQPYPAELIVRGVSMA